MDQTHTLIIGAGISGLSFANFTANPDYLIVEAQPEVGGYCRTVRRDGFVWDWGGDDMWLDRKTGEVTDT